jgi:hypothetical protein
MSRIRPGRLLLTVFILGFAVFFGLDLANKGITRVAGPAGEAGKSAYVANQPETRAVQAGTTGTGRQAGAGRTGTAGVKSGQARNEVKAADETDAEAAMAAVEPPVAVKRSFMNHLMNRVGEALHMLAKAVIGFVVAIFGSIIS